MDIAPCEIDEVDNDPVMPPLDQEEEATEPIATPGHAETAGVGVDDIAGVGGADLLVPEDTPADL